jgi:hypothetical protein
MTRRIPADLSIATVTVLLVLAVPWLSLGQLAARDSILLRGLLEKQDGSPVADEVVYLFPIKGREAVTLGLKFDDARKRWCPAANPKGVSDPLGGFAIQVTREWIANAGTERFGVGLFDGEPRLLYEDREPPSVFAVILTPKTFDEVQSLDLNTMFKKLIVR